MRYCFPTETDQGRMAELAGHFGSAPFFTIVDLDSDSLNILDNRDRNHVHGTCHPSRSFENLNIQAVVCGGMGLRAIQMFEKAGIGVYRTRNARTVEEALREIRENETEKIAPEEACAHHKGCR